jgi:hypothetical protein
MGRLKLILVITLAMIILIKREKFFLALLGVLVYALDALKSLLSPAPAPEKT